MMHQHIFPLQNAITSIPKIPRDELNTVDLLLNLQALRISILWTSFFTGHLKSLVYETPVNTSEDLIAQIVFAAGDIPSFISAFYPVH